MSTIDEQVDQFLAALDRFDETHPKALLEGHQEVVCSAGQCAGMTLQTSLCHSRSNQKNFRGLNGEVFTIMSKEEVADWVDFLKNNISSDPDKGVCTCGALKLSDF